MSQLTYSLLFIVPGTNSTIVAQYTPSQPKVLITILIIVFAVVMAAVIAKVANVIYDRSRAVRDDNSDISDNTRNIIKTRLMLISLQRKSRNLGLGQKFFRYWSRRANSSLSNGDSFDKGKNAVINVEEAQRGNDVQGAEKAAALNEALSLALHPETKPSTSKTKQSTVKNTPRRTPPLSKRESFAGPNVRSSDSRPESTSAGDKSAGSTVRSTTSISIHTPNGNKNKKVTFQENVEVKG